MLTVSGYLFWFVFFGAFLETDCWVTAIKPTTVTFTLNHKISVLVLQFQYFSRVVTALWLVLPSSWKTNSGGLATSALACSPTWIFPERKSSWWDQFVVTVAVADLSLGRAVQARLWEVPAEICWMATPSRPMTFLGLVIGPVEFPCPHWPIELLPHAYTSLSASGLSTTRSKQICHISSWKLHITLNWQGLQICYYIRLLATALNKHINFLCQQKNWLTETVWVF